DGAGIAPDMLENVFDLFVQAARTLDRAQGGIGVGLTLVRSLVTMHGGTVSARSDGEGKGSEFVVRLPLASPNAIRPPPPGSRAGLAMKRGARVVIVEDNDDSREMLCEVLTMAGFECKTADNGLTGMAVIQATR